LWALLLAVLNLSGSVTGVIYFVRRMIEKCVVRKRSVSKTCPVVGFDISGVEPSDSATGQLISKMDLSE